MKPRSLLIVLLIVVFVLGLGYALMREVGREEAELARSISGVVEVAPALYARGAADLVRTDRLVLALVDPQSREPLALKFISPLSPPQTFVIGQQNVRGEAQLPGSLLLVAITDKDGEIFKVTPGEVYGLFAGPLALGTEQVRLVLDQPFRGGLFNGAGKKQARAGRSSTPGAPGRTRRVAPSRGGSPPSARERGAKRGVRGVVRVAPGLEGGIDPADRLVIRLVDPQTGRPVASKIVPHLFPPQRFSIGLPPGVAANADNRYGLTILTDKDNDPANAVAGEIVGHSKAPILLGTSGLDFLLDQPYRP